MPFAFTKNTLKWPNWPFQCIFGKGKMHFSIFSVIPRYLCTNHSESVKGCLIRLWLCLQAYRTPLNGFLRSNDKIACFCTILGHPKRDIDMKGQQAVLLLLPKTATCVAKNFKSCNGWSQLSVDIFNASGDLLVVQKS